jgi:hypothetical protein
MFVWLAGLVVKPAVQYLIALYLVSAPLLQPAGEP